MGPVSLFRTVVVCCALSGMAATAQAPLDERVALVIGNAAYPAAPLANPANDAKAMGEALRGLGFNVVELRDGNKAQMAEAIAKVREQLKGKQGVGMLYYAGHGLQLDWRNYMVPVDAKLATASDVPAQTIDLGNVIDAFKAAGNRMNIVVLDACRDNPFTGSASGKGLAQLDAPPGTILAYATAPGNVADDGPGTNGLYTQFLLQELKRPVVKIEDVFKRVRLQVRQSSQGRQIPWESTSLEDDFVFNTGKLVVAAAPDERARSVAFDAQRADWERIKASKSVDDFYEFLKKYPSGSFSELAQTRVESLQKAQIRVQADQSGRVQGSFDVRYREGDRYEFVVKDGLTGVTLTRASAVVKVVSEDEVLLPGTGIPTTRGTRAGFLLQDGGGTYDPPWAFLPGGEFQVGKKLEGRAIRTDLRGGDKQWMDYESRVAAREKIDTALGPIDTYRVEVKMLMQSGLRRNFTFWFDPDWGMAVKFRQEFRRGNSSTPEIVVREMTARQRGGN